MAVTDSYATVATYRDIVSKTDTSDDTQIANDLLAVSRWLDQRLGRFFTKDAAPVARVYSVPGSLRTLGQLPVGWAESENPYRWGPWARHLLTEDMAAAPTSVYVDDNQDGSFVGETALNLTALGGPGMLQDVELWPQNAGLGPEPQPWTTLVLPARSSRLGFLAGQRVQVTATWGWPAVPWAIVAATCHLTGILRLESPRATSRVNELNQVVSVNAQARAMVDDLAGRYLRKESVI